jgi:putative spermidine/putrescine transport system ATP-binding protein
MSFLELQGLSKHYAGVEAVSRCDLSIGKGEFVCLLGPSGCGKTTTLQMVAGFTQPTTGRILLDGVDITDHKPHQRGLGVVFQSYALFPHMTVEANVSFGLEMRRMPAAERRVQVAEAMELVHLGAMAKRYPRELSGGQRQRVAMARALVIQPPVLLLDEPMGALDAKLREEVQLELRALQRRLGITTIMVTHDQAEAMTLADRVILMNKGRVEQIAAPLDMYERPNGRFSSTFLGKANVFKARCESPGGPIRYRSVTLPGTSALTGDFDYIVRPEKLELLAEGSARRVLSGTVLTRIFLGSQWLYQLESALGAIQVAHANTSGPLAGEGETVDVGWSAEHIQTVACTAEGTRP